MMTTKVEHWSRTPMIFIVGRSYKADLERLARPQEAP